MKLSKQKAVPKSDTLKYGLSQIFLIGANRFPTDGSRLAKNQCAVEISQWPIANAPKTLAEGILRRLRRIIRYGIALRDECV